MSAELLPEGRNDVVGGSSLDIVLEPVDTADTVSGAPRHGVAELGTIEGAEVGLWELRDGTVIDTEIDELFVVISGGATVEFLDEPAEQGDPGSRSVTVGVGDIMRLVAGSKTRWTVEDHIRKVYIAAE